VLLVGLLPAVNSLAARYVTHGQLDDGISRNAHSIKVKGKAVLQHTYEGAGGSGCIDPKH
jgi:hypothetical protein